MGEDGQILVTTLPTAGVGSSLLSGKVRVCSGSRLSPIFHPPSSRSQPRRWFGHRLPPSCLPIARSSPAGMGKMQFGSVLFCTAPVLDLCVCTVTSSHCA